MPPDSPTGSPPPAPDSPPPDATATESSLWGRYRALPVWAQILIPVVIIAILIGIWAIVTSDSDESSSADTTVVAGSSMDDVLTGIILVGGIRAQDTTTATTTEVVTTEPATTEPATTEPATTEPIELTTTVAPPAPTTTAGANVPPATEAPVTAPPTEPPPTEPPEPPTTEATTTTEDAPPTTDGSTVALPNPADFLTQWNAAAEGTDVPVLSRDQITQIVDGPFAGAFLATLVPNQGSSTAPQVGLIGTLSTTDPTQLSELLLVYVSGPDESASDFYWEAFGVLTQAVDPTTTETQIADLEARLGRADGMPPFPEGTDNVADSNGFNYNLYTGATREGLPATGIAVS